jgi:hypothetical protein
MSSERVLKLGWCSHEIGKLAQLFVSALSAGFKSLGIDIT